jgi:hypothetical protein
MTTDDVATIACPQCGLMHHGPAQDLVSCEDCDYPLDVDVDEECSVCGGDGWIDFARWSPVLGDVTSRERCMECNPPEPDETGMESARDARDLLLIDNGEG